MKGILTWQSASFPGSEISEPTFAAARVVSFALLAASRALADTILTQTVTPTLTVTVTPTQ